MRWAIAGFLAFAVLTGCSREPTENQAEQAAPAAEAPAPVPEAPPPPEPIAAATELPLNTVDSVMLSRPVDAPMAVVIRVLGTAISPGWTNARLAEDPEGSSEATTMTYRLVATSPEMPNDDRTAQPMDVELRVDSLPAEVTMIRIVSATNELSVPLTQ